MTTQDDMSDRPGSSDRPPTFMESVIKLVQLAIGDWSKVLQALAIVTVPLVVPVVVVVVVVSYLWTHPAGWLFLPLGIAAVALGRRLRQRRSPSGRGWARTARVLVSLTALAIAAAAGTTTGIWQALASDPAKGPWDWVERITWVLAIAGVVGSVLAGVLARRARAGVSPSTGGGPGGTA